MTTGIPPHTPRHTNWVCVCVSSGKILGPVLSPGLGCLGHPLRGKHPEARKRNPGTQTLSKFADLLSQAMLTN